jgi:hypothetical protein
LTYSELVAKHIGLYRQEEARRRSQAAQYEKRAKWLKTRKQGKVRFILTRGVFVWGLPLFIIYNAIHIYVLGHEGFKDPIWLTVTGPLWCAAACFEHLKIWNTNEKRFNLS